MSRLRARGLPHSVFQDLRLGWRFHFGCCVIFRIFSLRARPLSESCPSKWQQQGHVFRCPVSLPFFGEYTRFHKFRSVFFGWQARAVSHLYTCKCRWLSDAFRCLAIQLRPLGESVPYQVHSPKRWQQSRAGCNNNNVVLQQTSSYRIFVRAYDACRVKKHIRTYLAYLK